MYNSLVSTLRKAQRSRSSSWSSSRPPSPGVLIRTVFCLRRSATPYFMTWPWVCTTFTASPNPSYTEINSIEIEQLRLQLAELQAENEAHQTELKTKIETHQAEMRAQSEAREEERRTLRNRQEVLAEEIAGMRCEIEGLHATITSKHEHIQSKEGENRELQSKMAELSASLSEMKTENEWLQETLLSKHREIKSKQCEIHTKTRELSAKYDNCCQKCGNFRHSRSLSH